MHRLKTSLYNKLGKQLSKAIKHVKRTFLSPESLQDQEKLTLKELKKKFPNSYRSTSCKKRPPTCKKHHKTSKRTSPGTTDNLSPPGSCHIEGKKWIQNSNKQIKAQRAVLNHRGNTKK